MKPPPTSIASRASVAVGLPQLLSTPCVDAAFELQYAVRAEHLGFDCLWVQEAMFTPVPILDPIELLTFAAAVTTRARLAVGVLVLPRHNPVVLAKRLATLDQLSGGRLTVGVAVGDKHDPSARTGDDDVPRRERFTETLDAMQALWAGDAARYNGRLWRLDGWRMQPPPRQSPRPPLWFGGSHPAALDRAVTLGDGWLGSGGATVTSFAQQASAVRARLEHRHPSERAFTIAKRVCILVDERESRARRHWRSYLAGVYGAPDALPGQALVAGSPERCRELLEEIISAGAAHLALTPIVNDIAQLDALASITGLRPVRDL